MASYQFLVPEWIKSNINAENFSKCDIKMNQYVWKQKAPHMNAKPSFHNERTTFSFLPFVISVLISELLPWSGATHPRWYRRCQAPSSLCTQTQDPNLAAVWSLNETRAQPLSHTVTIASVCAHGRILVWISVHVHGLRLHWRVECTGELV